MACKVLASSIVFILEILESMNKQMAIKIFTLVPIENYHQHSAITLLYFFLTYRKNVTIFNIMLTEISSKCLFSLVMLRTFGKKNSIDMT